MPAQIGGALADIDAVHDRLTGASVASEAHAGDVAADVGRLQAEVEDVTGTLQRIFEQRADDLLRAISDASRTLEAADWAGGSRQAATAAEARLTGDVGTTVEAARAGIDSLSRALREQVSGFYEEVNGQFGTVMGDIHTAYAELARGADLFARNLEEADRTISFGG
ncbi:MAG: hypothetical protein AAF480_02170 [Actinomycetota bacterium]